MASARAHARNTRPLSCDRATPKRVIRAMAKGQSRQVDDSRLPKTFPFLIPEACSLALPPARGPSRHAVGHFVAKGLVEPQGGVKRAGIWRGGEVTRCHPKEGPRSKRGKPLGLKPKRLQRAGKVHLPFLHLRRSAPVLFGITLRAARGGELGRPAPRGGPQGLCCSMLRTRPSSLAKRSCLTERQTPR